jgi:heat shock protein HslJ
MRRAVLITVALVATTLLVACTSSTTRLTGRMWQLTSVTGQTPAFQGVVPVADQHRYTITFDDDGTFSAQADCNQLSGTYTTSGNSMTITPGPMTLAACPADSMADQYVAALSQVATFAAGNSVLTLTLSSGDSLVFG